jgi:hypothetical protein
MRQDPKEKLEQIIDGLKCPKNFKCYHSGLRNLCRAKLTGGSVSYLMCLEENPKACLFSKPFSGDDTHVCTCPLRIYIADKLRK